MWGGDGEDVLREGGVAREEQRCCIRTCVLLGVWRQAAAALHCHVQWRSRAAAITAAATAAAAAAARLLGHPRAFAERMQQLAHKRLVSIRKYQHSPHCRCQGRVPNDLAECLRAREVLRVRRNVCVERGRESRGPVDTVC